jgi:hypothetical protein
MFMLSVYAYRSERYFEDGRIAIDMKILPFQDRFQESLEPTPPSTHFRRSIQIGKP